MPDPYASIAQADESLQTRLAEVLELRAVDLQQRAMLSAYLSELQLPNAAIALDVGCGTGAVTRVLAELPRIHEVVGIDPSPIFVAKARELARGHGRLSFLIGDGRALPFADASFDVVVSSLSPVFAAMATRRQLNQRICLRSLIAAPTCWRQPEALVPTRRQRSRAKRVGEQRQASSSVTFPSLA